MLTGTWNRHETSTAKKTKSSERPTKGTKGRIFNFHFLITWNGSVQVPIWNWFDQQRTVLRLGQNKKKLWKWEQKLRTFSSFGMQFCNFLMDEDSQNYLSNDTSFKLTYSGKEGLIKMSGKVPKVVENMCEKVQHLRKPHTWILVKEKYDSRKGHADCYTPLLIAPEEVGTRKKNKKKFG